MFYILKLIINDIKVTSSYRTRNVLTMDRKYIYLCTFRV